MEPRRFVYTHRGNGRPTGQVCDRHHQYRTAEQPGGVGIWESPNCWHNETDGRASDLSMDDLYRVFLMEEHMEVGHNAPVMGAPWAGITSCSLCEIAREGEGHSPW